MNAARLGAQRTPELLTPLVLWRRDDAVFSTVTLRPVGVLRVRITACGGHDAIARKALGVDGGHTWQALGTQTRGGRKEAS